MKSNWTLASQGAPHVLSDNDDFSGGDRFEIILCYFY